MHIPNWVWLYLLMNTYFTRLSIWKLHDSFFLQWLLGFVGKCMSNVDYSRSPSCTLVSNMPNMFKPHCFIKLKVDKGGPWYVPLIHLDSWKLNKK